MIYYDSHNWWSLCRFRGSVFPRAFKLAMPSAVAAYVLSYLVQNGDIQVPDMEKIEESNSVYSGFTFVLGFSLVFRTAESYHRFWTAATSCHEMGSEWSDCCSSLIAFAQTSKKSQEKVQRFTHTVIRLFCLLHAMALEEIADLKDGHCPLIDIEGFNQRDLRMLLSEEVQGKRVQVVLCWIKLLIIESIDSGLIAVPAPIVTRVFQELGMGLVEYHKAQQVVIWPFPFPYTQMNLVLVYIYMCITPLVISTWGMEPWLAAVFTVFSCVCMVGLDLIASELENPFGDDDNDLPVREIHMQMTRVLLAQLNRKTWRVPRLLPSAVLDHPTLVLQSGIHKDHDQEQEKCWQSVKRWGRKAAQSRDRVRCQLDWARGGSGSKQDTARQLSRFGSWLKLPFRETEFWARGSVDIGTGEEIEYEDHEESKVLDLAEYGSEGVVRDSFSCDDGLVRSPGASYAPTSPISDSWGGARQPSMRSLASTRGGSMRSAGLEPMERQTGGMFYGDMADRHGPASSCRSSTLPTTNRSHSNLDPNVGMSSVSLLADVFAQKLEVVMEDHCQRLEAIMEKQAVSQHGTFNWQTTSSSAQGPNGSYVGSWQPHNSTCSTSTADFAPTPSLLPIPAKGGALAPNGSAGRKKVSLLVGPSMAASTIKPEIPEIEG
mmetsp:Transcript_60323/g.143703  ORF Transcript_60323/g.143703 Transcript_60323/m.143703 type:complete len:659 (-) Transcript_60323:229-2205(-)|eukprot:CAMPEP_0178381230 /NCGR_PEP_ID=MMETSP0689_2-20121128/5873_1 /TAXON_ID=160604 /ORGANISM="Amphidinium massartii, Strain CS-259" /LENGTH=658 /DNA_ID=CAMNT_0020001401 /DNA_START=56 /DNA_END=2032 /DNA_ORIENTATION=+